MVLVDALVYIQELLLNMCAPLLSQLLSKISPRFLARGKVAVLEFLDHGFEVVGKVDSLVERLVLL